MCFENHDGTQFLQDVNYNCVCKSLWMGITPRIQRGIMLVCAEFSHKLRLNWGLLACLLKNYDNGIPIRFNDKLSSNIVGFEF